MQVTLMPLSLGYKVPPGKKGEFERCPPEGDECKGDLHQENGRLGGIRQNEGRLGETSKFTTESHKMLQGDVG